ncbi:hypothetical protein PILCRDRAFT_137848 [Piloderma croceum F 1598]|uniref:Uncharacterized protein n=1 Tax=Piloderma croceum (strain F 1598) TaxID=765440 RepID=A0A0C3BYT8_PILCF|nr:hypothetical protein PILCRDRAFT_137848 [Piloderma croceum F 1598]
MLFFSEVVPKYGPNKSRHFDYILKEVALTLIRHSLSACHLTVAEFTEMRNSLMRLAWASNHETGSTLSLGAKGFPSYDNSIGRSGRRAHAERSDAIHGDLNWPPIGM